MTNWLNTGFNSFIVKEENRRGNLISFSGEATTTWFKFLFGLFSFVFTRRVTTVRSYDVFALNTITRNYATRIQEGRVPKFDADHIRADIAAMRNHYDERDKSFWSGNSARHVGRLRTIQRAECYERALVGAAPRTLTNPENSIQGAIKGVLSGFFGGLLSLILGFGFFFFLLFCIGQIIGLFID